MERYISKHLKIQSWLYFAGNPRKHMVRIQMLHLFYFTTNVTYVTCWDFHVPVQVVSYWRAWNTWGPLSDAFQCSAQLRRITLSASMKGGPSHKSYQHWPKGVTLLWGRQWALGKFEKCNGVEFVKVMMTQKTCSESRTQSDSITPEHCMQNQPEKCFLTFYLPLAGSQVSLYTGQLKSRVRPDELFGSTALHFCTKEKAVQESQIPKTPLLYPEVAVSLVTAALSSVSRECVHSLPVLWVWSTSCSGHQWPG